MNYLLITIYALLLLQHSTGLALNSFLIFQNNLPPGKIFPLTFSVLASLPLFLSDILIVVILSSASKRGIFEDLVVNFEAFALIGFSIIYCNLYDLQAVSVLKGIAREFHAFAHGLSNAKNILLTIVFFIGYPLSYLSPGYYLPIFIMWWFYFTFSFSFCFIFILKQKISTLKLRTAPASSAAQNLVSIERSNTSNHIPTINVKRSQSYQVDEVGKVLFEMESNFNIALNAMIMVALPTAILLYFFHSPEQFVTGIVITIPWKISIGIANLINPLVHFSLRDK